VQRLRKARGFSQRDLARLAGVPSRTLARLERGGHVTRVPLAVLARLALALAVGLEVLCGYEATPETGTHHHWPLEWQPVVSALPLKAEGEG
jgi:transcriptional regulator with XRE-family HTH domain